MSKVNKKLKIMALGILKRNTGGSKNQIAAAARRVADGTGSSADVADVQAYAQRMSGFSSGINSTTNQITNALGTWNNATGRATEMASEIQGVVEAQRAGTPLAPLELRLTRNLMRGTESFLKSQFGKTTTKAADSVLAKLGMQAGSATAFRSFMLRSLKLAGPVVGIAQQAVDLVQAGFDRQKANAIAQRRAIETTDSTYGYNKFAVGQRQHAERLAEATQGPVADLLALFGMGQTATERAGELATKRAATFRGVRSNAAAFGISTAEQQRAIYQYALKHNTSPGNLTEVQKNEALNEIINNKVESLVPDNQLEAQAALRGTPNYPAERRLLKEQLGTENAEAAIEARHELLASIDRRMTHLLNNPAFLATVLNDKGDFYDGSGRFRGNARTRDQFEEALKVSQANYQAAMGRRKQVEYD